MKKIFLLFILSLFLFLFFDLTLTFGVNGIPNGEKIVCPDLSTQDCGTCGVQTCVDGVWSECVETTKPDTTETIGWDEYRCSEKKGCGEDYIERRICSQARTRTVTCAGRGVWNVGRWGEWSEPPSCGTASNIENCDKSWQRCQRKETDIREWLREKPQCLCEGECLKTPENPRYYNNPNFPTDPKNPEKSKDPKNILLPVKLDWDDVEGWNKKTGPQSYRINIDNTRPENPFEGTTDKSEFVPDSCTLKSNATHPWQVQACCGADGKNCGPSSSWNFTTALSPELVSPADPDWVGPEGKENVSIPTTLKWCNVEEAQSYFWQFYKYEEEEDNFSLIFPAQVAKDDNLKSEITLDTEFITKFTTYAWEIAACLNKDGTQCGINCGPGQEGDECGNYSQFWEFTTGDITIPPPEISSPLIVNGAIPVVNFTDYLEWTLMGLKGAMFYYYEIIKEGEVVFSSFAAGDVTSVSFEDLWQYLEFNQDYNWTIRSCWDEQEGSCEEETNESVFITTGAPPTNLNETPSDEHGNKIIPVILDWDDMPGSASYKYEISSTPGFENENIVAKGKSNPRSNASVSYDKLKMETFYWWRVKTCADRESNVCGEPSYQNFTTFKLAIPVNPDPKDGDNFYTHERHLKWKGVLGANYYQYKIYYQGVKKISLTLVPTNSAFLDIPRFELGNYTWYVRACLDKNCQYVGDFAGPWNFTLVEGVEVCKPGLIPCGRNCDYLGTPHWNERDPCEFRHIFLLIHIIINFLLWTVVPLILVLLTVATGIMFYFSLSTGTAESLAGIKSLWKSAGIGFGIIFFAWTALNLILSIFGFQITIFGNWYELPV